MMICFAEGRQYCICYCFGYMGRYCRGKWAYFSRHGLFTACRTKQATPYRALLPSCDMALFYMRLPSAFLSPAFCFGIYPLIIPTEGGDYCRCPVSFSGCPDAVAASVSQWNGSNSEFLSVHDGLRMANITNGIPVTTTHPVISTAYQTVLLPVDICAGGIKLNTKASSEPRNPSPATIHISRLPFFPMLNGR